MSLDEHGREIVALPRLPSDKEYLGREVAPNLYALITEIPGEAWTEFCQLVNENHDLKILLAEREIQLARTRGASRLYKGMHSSVVAMINFLDPPTDF
jgi:hypothetical protein